MKTLISNLKPWQILFIILAILGTVRFIVYIGITKGKDEDSEKTED